MVFVLPPPLSSLLKRPSFEDRKRLGMAQRRKGGNFKSKSRYSSLHFLIRGLLFWLGFVFCWFGVFFLLFCAPPSFSPSYDCLKVLAKKFVGSAVGHPPTAGLMQSRMLPWIARCWPWDGTAQKMLSAVPSLPLRAWLMQCHFKYLLFQVQEKVRIVGNYGTGDLDKADVSDALSGPGFVCTVRRKLQ